MKNKTYEFIQLLMYIRAVTSQASFQKAEILLFKTLGKSECLGEKFKLTRYIYTKEFCKRGRGLSAAI